MCISEDQPAFEDGFMIIGDMKLFIYIDIFEELHNGPVKKKKKKKVIPSVPTLIVAETNLMILFFSWVHMENWFVQMKVWDS